MNAPNKTVFNASCHSLSALGTHRALACNVLNRDTVQDVSVHDAYGNFFRPQKPVLWRTPTPGELQWLSDSRQQRPRQTPALVAELSGKLYVIWEHQASAGQTSADRPEAERTTG